MAQAFARFGSSVTLFETHGRVLPRDDADASQLVMAALRRDGVDLQVEASVVRVETIDGDKHVTSRVGGGESTAPFDEILVAAGRTPNVEDLNLDEAHVQYDRHGVKVDVRLRTSNPRIYAAGDICFPLKFTHAADFLARNVIRNALFFGRARTTDLVIPWCTYTSPEVAHVGLSAQEAAEKGIRTQTFTQPLSDVDRALLDGQDEGFVKLHVKAGSDRIVGATIVSAHAGDLVSEIAVAMKNGVGLKAIGATIHPYPTQAEAIRKLGDQFNRTRLTPLTKWVLQRLLSIGRRF
jgi:pyruvate/2-oxoglutarate dehydrogenase complex dihydrolipoamide dehydrogenase (E3) component